MIISYDGHHRFIHTYISDDLKRCTVISAQKHEDQSIEHFQINDAITARGASSELYDAYTFLYYSRNTWRNLIRFFAFDG